MWLAPQTVLPLLGLLLFTHWVEAAPTCQRKTASVQPTSTQTQRSDAGASSGSSTKISDVVHIIQTQDPSTSSSETQGSGDGTTVHKTVTSYVTKTGTHNVKVKQTNSGNSPVISKSETASSSSPNAIISPESTTSVTPTTTATTTTTTKPEPTKSESPPDNGKSKMGISWPIQEEDAAPVAKFFTDSSSVAWWYNWNKNWNQGLLTSSGVSISGEFVPMLYDPTFYDNSDPLQSGFTEIFGYNEPDHYDRNVATTVGAAAAAEINKSPPSAQHTQAPRSTLLQSLAISHGWISSLLPSALPTLPPTLTATNFGVAGTPSASDISQFMAETTKWLNEQSWVVKYAWFGAARNEKNLGGVPEGNRLMDASGQLTALGKQYMNGGQSA
ncbi:uncharacterized protein L203_106186 [Cryptococcus depauperatus CBS 7841]|uniref:Asl1-like glycosyl hydrolase catalytic domain-containing protein n=1 Tax=Cryptococcus depauperatus CBS 7841 TaxID=1295531 RepID=A0AAJ8JYU7_9TREE